jgi:hypothetical protein
MKGWEIKRRNETRKGKERYRQSYTPRFLLLVEFSGWLEGIRWVTPSASYLEHPQNQATPLIHRGKFH